MSLSFQNYIAIIASPLGDPSINSCVLEKICQLLALPFAIHGATVLIRYCLDLQGDQVNICFKLKHKLIFVLRTFSNILKYTWNHCRTF